MKMRNIFAASVAGFAFAATVAINAPQLKSTEQNAIALNDALPVLTEESAAPAPQSVQARERIAPARIAQKPEPALFARQSAPARQPQDAAPDKVEPLFSQQSAPVTAEDYPARSGEDAAPFPEHAKASMQVAINPAALDAPRIDLDLFGEKVMGVRDRIDRQKADTVIWHGHIQGNPGEMVTIVSHRGAWSAMIDYEGRKFELAGAPAGGLLFNEVDTAALPANDDDGIPSPQGAAPFSLPDYAASSASGAAAPAIDGAPVQQDLLVVYTDDACAGGGGTPGVDCSGVEAAIVAAVADMNQSYQMSEINIVSNLVGMLEVSYNEDGAYQGEMLDQIRSTNDGIIDNVHDERDALGADIVSFIVQDGDGYCGQGYRPAHASTAFSWTMRSCLSNRTQHHEIGHNQGSSHARSQDANAQPGVYRYGYRRCDDGSVDDVGSPFFRTIMAYGCSGASRTGFFANPNVNHLGVPTGIDPDVDPNNAAYSARTLNESASYMAGFRDPPPPPPPPPTSPPAAPSSLSASAAGSDRIDLSWSDNASDETAYRVDRSLDGSSWAQLASLGANISGYGDTGLNADTLYYYRVRAENSAGNSAWSNTASARTDVTAPPPPPPTPPAAPSSLSAAAAGSDRINISWSDNASDETGFRVDRSLNGSTWAQRASLSANATGFNDTGLNADTRYYYRVRAENSAGNSAWSNTSSVKTDAATPTPPAAPNNLTASAAGTDQINIAWSDNSTNETSFRVDRSPNGSSWTQIATLGANATSHGDNGLNADTRYYYRVRAINSAGASAWSNTASVKTDPQLAPVDDRALSDVAVAGTVSGSYSATHAPGGNVQTIAEKRLANGKVGMEHRWVFDVAGGAGDVVFTASAWTKTKGGVGSGGSKGAKSGGKLRPPGSGGSAPGAQGEGVNFYYSTDGGASYRLMFTVNGHRISGKQYRYTLPAGTRGQVIVRIRDAERRRFEAQETVIVDDLVFTSQMFDPPTVTKTARRKAPGAVPRHMRPALETPRGDQRRDDRRASSGR